MISVGQKLKLKFKLKIVQHDEEREVAFQDLLTRPTIVSVYMKNNTPGCDRQNDDLAKHTAEFEAAGFNLIALSRDTCGSHKRYAAKKGIAYTLASDPDDLFAQATDSVVEKKMYGRTFHGPRRAAYVIDTDGTVLAVIEKVDTADHAAQVRAALLTRE
ncbi:MAG: redoxin domain-containing protein [Opitutaceae bacterium]|nr:redoxin domain-containing protein [Opitutaceae bacterium]